MIRFAALSWAGVMLIDIVNEGICLYCPRLAMLKGMELSGTWLLDRTMTGKSSTYKSFLELMFVPPICRGWNPGMGIDNESIKRLKSIWWMPWH